MCGQCRESAVSREMAWSAQKAGRLCTASHPCQARRGAPATGRSCVDLSARGPRPIGPKELIQRRIEHAEPLQEIQNSEAAAQKAALLIAQPQARSGDTDLRWIIRAPSSAQHIA